jgi:hypothetical protein
MTRILLIQTASPKRICAKAEQILRAEPYPSLEVFILCREKDRDRFRHLAQTTVCPLHRPTLDGARHKLPRAKFDRVLAFWTGEKRFRSWKLLALRLKASNTYIIGGDGNEFELTWKAICRHALFRLRHSLPTDHYDFLDDEVPAVPIDGGASHTVHEKVLILQSAEPPYVLKALDQLKKKPLFINPSFTVFCRNKPEAVKTFQSNPQLNKVVTHSETQGSFRHLRALRRQRFDAAILFLTGDPSYWKVKIFAFLLGIHRILIFNEGADCFFFNIHQWLALIFYRIQARPSPMEGSKWGHSTRILVSLVLKSVILPFRFLWLLLVWLRLRTAGLKSSRVGNDYSL